MSLEPIDFTGGRRETRTPDPLGVKEKLVFSKSHILNTLSSIIRIIPGKNTAKTGIDKIWAVTITTHCFLALFFPVTTHAASLNATASVEIVKSIVDVQYVQKMHAPDAAIPASELSGNSGQLVIDPDNSYQVVKQPWGVEVVYE